MGGRLASVAVACAMLLAVAPGVLGRRTHGAGEAEVGMRVAPAGDYVSSAACKSCHPGPYASWHRTFHRTMTQPASAAFVRAELDAKLELDGLAYEVRRRGDEVWATLPATGERRLVLSTGSHHYQGYWFEGAREGELSMFPFVYVFREQRWFPRRDVFLQPPDGPEHAARWNSNCIQCHATAGQPGRARAEGRFETEAAELGIACEACHGPGGDHVRRFRDPVERYEAYAHPGAVTDIVNPARLPADRASMICGQCHAFTYPKDEDEWWRRGYVRTFRPGADLAGARILLTPGALTEAGAPDVEADVDSMFWPDGTVRVGGREYNGLVVSACYLKGKGDRQLSCLSCHAMHAGAPDRQLAPGKLGNEACLPCHGEKRQDTTHTHHLPASSGSLCVSCHMPKTTYALLKSIASHRIDSPTGTDDIAAGRPPACNLCHLDRSLAWTRSRLRAWYGAGPPAADELEASSSPVGAFWLLAGDAAERVIAAASMSSEGALAASGATWQAPLLAQALLDPYAAVRIVACRSLRALPGVESFDCDPLGSQEERAHMAGSIVTRWEQTHGRAFDRPRVDLLVARRDDRRITISE